MTKIRVGSRESKLAVKQAEIVMNAIKAHNRNVQFELVTIKTTGDKMLDTRLDKIGGKGLFIKELEQALIEHDIDIAVHSYKDMPYEASEEINDALEIVALSKRESPFDALVLPEKSLRGFDGFAGLNPVGSSSLRRSVQFKMLCDTAEVLPIRGNVLTRIKKLDGGEFGAIILAQAGLSRLGLEHKTAHLFSPDEMIPAACQGILAVQGRRGDSYTYLEGFHNKQSEYAARAERRFLETLKSGCGAAVAAYCEINGAEAVLYGMCENEDGDIVKDILTGRTDDTTSLGERLAKSLYRNTGGGR